jgi:hypothetical protein
VAAALSPLSIPPILPGSTGSGANAGTPALRLALDVALRLDAVLKLKTRTLVVEVMGIDPKRTPSSEILELGSNAERTALAGLLALVVLSSVVRIKSALSVADALSEGERVERMTSAVSTANANGSNGDGEAESVAVGPEKPKPPSPLELASKASASDAEVVSPPVPAAQRSDNAEDDTTVSSI